MPASVAHQIQEVKRILTNLWLVTLAQMNYHGQARPDRLQWVIAAAMRLDFLLGEGLAMDPDQTVRLLLEALAEEDWDQVAELSQALREWLDKGGFPPIIIGDPSLGDRWHRTIARLLCRLAAAMLP